MNNIDMKNELGVFAEYTPKIYKNGKIKETLPTQKNLILDRFFDYWKTGTSWGGAGKSKLSVGTGTSTPLVSDTSLENLLTTSPLDAPSSIKTIAPDSSYMDIGLKWDFTFPIGGVVGTITELGIVTDSDDRLITRSLFKDINGDPTSITVLADEQLVVEYTLTLRVDTELSTGIVNLAGIDYTWNFGWARGYGLVDLLSKTPVMIIPRAADSVNVVSVGSQVSIGNELAISDPIYTRDGSLTVLAKISIQATQANFAGGIGGIVFGAFAGNSTFAGTYVKFTPKIPKTDIQKLDLTFSSTLSRV